MNQTTYAYLGGAWVDISSDVLASPGLSCNTGIKGNRETDRVASAGSLRFELKNNTGKYTPGSGTAHADWNKGTPIKVVFTSPGKSKTKFIGRVTSIKLKYEYNNNRASITALDWMHFATQLPLDIPALQTDKKANEIIDTIVGFSPIAPTATSYQTGTQTFPYAFHDNTVKTTAYSEITKATLSEWGYAYVKGDGTLVFEANGGRSATQKEITVVDEVSGFLLLEDGSYLLLEDGGRIELEPYDVSTESATATTIGAIDIEYGERMINRASVDVYPYRPGEQDVMVYRPENAQLVPANSTISFRVQFTDQSSRLPISAVTPSVKQYTLLHCDVPPDGVTGVMDEADQQIVNEFTAFEFVNGSYNTSFKKFGTASYAFDGLGDYVRSKSSQEKFNFRDGDFTVDWWEYRLASTSGKAAISRSSTGAYPGYVLGYSDGTTMRCYLTSNGSSWDIANAKSMGSVVTNTWTHYAITRSGNTFRTFKNGVQQDTWTSSATILPSTSALLSLALYNGNYFYGYIDEFRMIKGYAAYTANFTPPTSQYLMSGINWNVRTSASMYSGSEITPDMTLTTSVGGAGLDVTVTSTNASDGYLNFQVFAQPLESLSPLSYVAEDATSINSYGYYNESIQMRLQSNVTFPKTVADALVAAEKDPRMVLNKVSLVANKNITNEALFLDCDLGDLVRVTDSLSGYDELNHIQAVSWKAVPGDDGAIVYFDWLLKEQ